MRFLLDTHLLLWAAAEPEQLSSVARSLITDQGNTLLFSPVSIWEVAIKRGLGRSDFTFDPRLLRRGLLQNDYEELPLSSEHSVAVDGLPQLHKDPFDRILLAQATVEGMTLLTSDPVVARYPAPVRLV